MSTHFDLSTYIYSNLLNSKNVPQQFAAAIFCRGSLDPISRAVGFNTAEAALTQVVIILLAKLVDISKRSAISSVSMPCRSFININNSSSLSESLRPGPNF